MARSGIDELKVRMLAEEARGLADEITDFIQNLDKYSGEWDKRLLAMAYAQYVERFLSHYEDLCYRVQSVLPEIESSIMDLVSVSGGDIISRGEMVAILKSIAAASRALAEALDQYLGPSLSSEERDKLASLRAQIEELRDFELNLYKHLMYAIDEYEEGHYLSSSLVAGKVVQYIYEQLCKKLDASKVRDDKGGCSVELVAKQMAEVLGLKGKDRDKHLRELIKTSRLARNYFTHDINAIPEPQEALRLLSGACDLALKYRDVAEKLRSQNVP